MIDYSLSLNYHLNTGWLSPFIEGLKEGKLIGRQCTACSDTCVPPVRTCACGCSNGRWTALSGHARIVKRTIGSDGDFALARFEGADTMTVVSLESLSTDATTGVIKKIDTDAPALILISTAAE